MSRATRIVINKLAVLLKKKQKCNDNIEIKYYYENSIQIESKIVTTKFKQSYFSNIINRTIHDPPSK